MKLQTVLMITLLSTVAIGSQGIILKTLLKKKLSLIPSFGRPSNTSGNKGSSNGLISPQAGQTDQAISGISPLSESIQPDFIDEAALVEQVHPIPASVATYSYSPEFRTPSLYYRESGRPVVVRTVYEYVEAPRANLGPLGGIASSIPGLGGIVNGIPGLSDLSGNLKNIFRNALRAPTRPVSAPVTASTTTYIAYPPY